MQLIKLSDSVLNTRRCERTFVNQPTPPKGNHVDEIDVQLAHWKIDTWRVSRSCYSDGQLRRANSLPVLWMNSRFLGNPREKRRYSSQEQLEADEEYSIERDLRSNIFGDSQSISSNDFGSNFSQTNLEEALSLTDSENRRMRSICFE